MTLDVFIFNLNFWFEHGFKPTLGLKLYQYAKVN